MEINPTQKVQLYPVAKTTASRGQSLRKTHLQLRDDGELLRNSQKPRSRQEEHPQRFEKGSLLDIFV